MPYSSHQGSVIGFKQRGSAMSALEVALSQLQEGDRVVLSVLAGTVKNGQLRPSHPQGTKITTLVGVVRTTGESFVFMASGTSAGAEGADPGDSNNWPKTVESSLKITRDRITRVVRLSTGGR